MNGSTIAALALLAVTGCGASADDGASSSEHDTTTTPVSPLVLQRQTTTLGPILTTSAGMSLYTFDKDTTATSTCDGACATAWPPLLAGSTDVLATPFATSPRADGTKQVTFSGHPLYTYATDATPGDAKGDGVGGVWHIATPAWHVYTQTVVTSQGEVLSDVRAFSLYTFDADTTSASTCYEACATTWPPAIVSAGVEVDPPFALSARTDGTLQLTQNGHPLYNYSGDTKPAQINGDGIGKVWHLAKP